MPRNPHTPSMGVNVCVGVFQCLCLCVRECLCECARMCLRVLVCVIFLGMLGPFVLNLYVSVTQRREGDGDGKKGQLTCANFHRYHSSK